MKDEWKDVGRYFGEGEYVSLESGLDLGEAFTVEGWFIWMSGRGPLVSGGGQLEFIYDSGGRCAYRVGGSERVTEIPVEKVRDHWVFAAVARDESGFFG